MAKNGFQMIDAEMHVMEPVDLWERYIDPEFKARAPRRLQRAPLGHPHDGRGRGHGGHAARRLAGADSTPRRRRSGDRYAEEIARDFDPASQVRAMDKEGSTSRSSSRPRRCTSRPSTPMDARFAAAACRAYNDWLHDYIQAADPKRLFGAAAISPHDVDERRGRDAPRGERSSG